MAIKLNSRTLKVGDILCTQEGSGFVAFGQGLVMAFRAIVRQASTASFKWNHMAVYIGNGCLAHATGRGLVIDSLWSDPGNYRVYRCRKGGVGKEAGEIASRWAKGGGYSTGLATASVFHTKSMANNASDRAQYYYLYRNEIGGPDFQIDSQSKEQNWFCSMFVAAVYRAVAGPRCRDYMGVDPEGCSPMALVGYLKDNPTYWEKVVDYK